MHSAPAPLVVLRAADWRGSGGLSHPLPARPGSNPTRINYSFWDFRCREIPLLKLHSNPIAFAQVGSGWARATASKPPYQRI